MSTSRLYKEAYGKFAHTAKPEGTTDCNDSELSSSIKKSIGPLNTWQRRKNDKRHGVGHASPEDENKS